MEESIKTYYVIDASFVLSFLLSEGVSEVNNIFRQHAASEIVFISPTLLKYEVGNGLKSKALRKKIVKERANELYDRFLKLKIEEQELDYHEVLRVALSKNLSFYDASYLTLAKNLSAKLLTLDRVLGRINSHRRD